MNTIEIPRRHVGEPGWFEALLDEAVARPIGAGLFSGLSGRRGRDLDGAVRDACWTSGVLFGAPVDGVRSSIRGRGEAEDALVERVRFGTGVTAALVAHGTTEGRRLRIAAILAAHVSEFSTAAVLGEAADALDAGRSGPELKVTRRLVGIVGGRLQRAWSGVTPEPRGLALIPALLVLEFRALARLASRRRDARLRRSSLGFGSVLAREKAALVELATSFARAATPEPDRKVIIRQLRTAGLPTTTRRDLTRTLQLGPVASRLIAPMPRRTVELMTELTVLTFVAGNQWGPDVRAEMARTIERRLPQVATRLVEMEARALGELQLHAHEIAEKQSPSEPVRRWIAAAALAFRRATENVGRELEETRELGVLVTRAAQGERLTDDERRKVREQLVDLAKVIPSLAVFAAPGGLILLPLLVKVLPFDMRPSSFRPARRDVAALPPADSTPPG